MLTFRLSVSRRSLLSGARWHNEDPGVVERAAETSGVDFFTPADRERCPSVSQRHSTKLQKGNGDEIMSADV